ncbi:MAG: ABC transporter permease [Solirubrobacteraceae bacterium]
MIASAGRRSSGEPANVQQRSRLPVLELLGVALQGLRSRKLRAALSALGIAIGIAAMVAVVGVSSSAQANLIAEIDSLGTNLLTVTPGQSFSGGTVELPASAQPMISAMAHVQRSAAIYGTNESVYRTPYVPATESGGLNIEAVTGDLPRVISARMTSGRFLSPGEAQLPEAVLGSAAAENLQIHHLDGTVMVLIGNTWFTVIGTMGNAALDTTLNNDVFISLPMATEDFKIETNPSEIYVRTDQNSVTSVANLLGPTANPQEPNGVSVDRPSDVLEARAVAQGQFTTLLLGLGAVALLVGAIGIANIMVISVLERRGEVGLRRALGATRAHISAQILCESALLAAIGGACGLLLGAGATEIYAQTKHEPFIVPLYALIAAPAAGFLIGSLAGLYPAAKAARLSPTEALRA